MDLEVTNFIKKTIKEKKPSLKNLIEWIGKKYQTDPMYSDLSFITDQYRLTLMELWTEEFTQIFYDGTNSDEISDDEVIELLGTFRGLKAFNETPVKLQGTIYKLVKNQNDIFISKDFIKPRREICNVLTNKIMSFGQKTYNEYQFFNNLIDVLRNSFKQFEEVVTKLKLQLFVNGRVSFYAVARNVLANNYSIEKYDELKELAAKIENKTPYIQQVLQREIGKYVEKLISQEIEGSRTKSWLIQRKVLTSYDLNANFSLNVKEVHIVCDILHIDQDLPSSFRGKNVFLMANTTRLHGQSTWDLSGYDAPIKYTSNAGQFTNGDGKNGGNGDAGESGGNCEIFSAEINNAKFWTIKSIGGDGSNGQDGGNGENGINGHDVAEEDFKLRSTKLTKSNYLQLLKNVEINIETGSAYDLFNKKFGKIFTEFNMPAILLPYLFNRLIITTGSSAESENFRNKQAEYMLAGDFASAIEINVLNYREVVPKFLKIVNDESFSSSEAKTYLDQRVLSSIASGKKKSHEEMKKEIKHEINTMKKTFSFKTNEDDFKKDLGKVLGEFVTEVGKRKYAIKFREKNDKINIKTAEISMLKETQITRLKNIISNFALPDNEFNEKLLEINKNPTNNVNIGNEIVQMSNKESRSSTNKVINSSNTDDVPDVSDTLNSLFSDLKI